MFEQPKLEVETLYSNIRVHQSFHQATRYFANVGAPLDSLLNYQIIRKPYSSVPTLCVFTKPKKIGIQQIIMNPQNLLDYLKY